MTTAERSRRYRAKKHAQKFGQNAGDMRGRHGNHARGERNARWGGSKLVTSHGYIAVRVPIDHPHAWGPPALRRFKYAYEHILVMMAHIGRPIAENEIVHHRDGDRTNNDLRNLQLMTAADHQRLHANETRDRDSLGRFAPQDMRLKDPKGGDMAEWPEDLRVREFPAGGVLPAPCSPTQRDGIQANAPLMGDE